VQACKTFSPDRYLPLSASPDPAGPVRAVFTGRATEASRALIFSAPLRLCVESPERLTFAAAP